jgi:hypothetical protein
MTKESGGQDTCADVDPVVYCHEGTCLNGTCCCSNTREGDNCFSGEGVDDPCDPDPCNGELCVRAPTGAAFDIYCDIPDPSATTTTQSPIDNGSSDTKSTVFLLMVMSGLMALLVC